MTPLSPQDWHTRYTEQARWTVDLRHYIYAQAGLEQARCILDLGCGTGVLSAELGQMAPLAQVHGLDIDAAVLALSAQHAPGAHLTQADAAALPYADDSFDLTLCHFLLLWLPDPARALKELVRVTQPGGAVLALAEPDYGGRIDFPPELQPMGEWQRAALRAQGADPLLGRKLAGLFHSAGLQGVESGVLGGQWRGRPDPQARASEWAIIEHDLAGTLGLTAAELESLRAAEASAYAHGERVLFVPTFYAWGRAPQTYGHVDG